MRDSGYDDVVMHPIRSDREKSVPTTGLLFVNPSEAAHAARIIQAGGGEKRFLFNSGLWNNRDGTLFVAGPAVGAPMAALCLEKLIALGADRIVLVGWCGALEPILTVGSVLVPGRAVCGEGTSRYYGSGEDASPSLTLVQHVREILGRTGIAWQEGTVWSTDAPYREGRDLLEQLHREEGVVAVDMEYSALCAVAQFRKVAFAACMLVSDELWRQPWKAGFSNPAFRHRSRELVEILLENMVAG